MEDKEKKYSLNPDDFLKEILSEKDSIDPATEEIRVYLNKVIAKYELKTQAVIAVLAQISAGYVHSIKRDMPTPKTKDTIEDLYQHTYETFLAFFEFNDVLSEVEKEERRNLN